MEKPTKSSENQESKDEYLSFSDVCLDRLGLQAQYAFRFARGVDGYPNCGEGLRFQFRKGFHPDADYSSIKSIHKDDADEFVRCVNKARGK